MTCEDGHDVAHEAREKSLGPNDPTTGHGGEETTDWPKSEPPPAPGEVDPDGPTLAAPKFVRPPQQPPVTPPSGPPHQQPQAPPWGQQVTPPPHGPPPRTYPQYNQSPPGFPPHPGYQQPPAGGPPRSHPGRASAKPTLSTQIARHRWWVVGGAAALAAVVVVAVIATSGGDTDTASEQPSTTAPQVPAAPITTVASEPAAPAPVPAPSGPTLGADALPGLLLSAEQVSRRLNTPGMTASAVVKSPLDGTITPPHCAGAWGPVSAGTYNGSGYTGIAVQVMSLQPVVAAQAVVSFPDPGAAKNFFDKQYADWSSCQSTHITWSYAGDDAGVDVGVPAMTGDIMTLKLIPTTSAVPGHQCERDMTVRGNVIVDVRTCSPTVGSAGLSVTSDIAAKIR